MRIRLLGLIMLLLASIATPVSAQTDVGLTVKSMKPFQEVVGEKTNPRYASVSPDGTMIARVEKDSICLFTFADGKDNCIAWPKTLRSPTVLYWSPDSKYIAMHENVFVYLLDSDIWLLDVKAQTITDITDDGYLGDVLKLPPTAFLDYLPTWNPATGELYFFRTHRSSDSGKTSYTLDLYRFASIGGDPELVAQYTDDLPGPLSVYEAQYPMLDGASAISPDGKQMAILVRPAQKDDPGHGIYLLDLAGKEKPKRILDTTAGLTAGLPSWMQPLPLVSGLSWTADSKGLIFMAEDNTGSLKGPARMIYHLDVATAKVTPLLDFTAVKDAASFYQIDGQGNSPINAVPMAAVYLPSKNVVLTYSGLAQGNKISITALRFPPDKVESVVLHTIETPSIIPMYTMSVSSDAKKALLFGYVIEME